MAKKKAAKSPRRQAFKSWVKKHLDIARDKVIEHKHRTRIGKPETQSEGIERTRRLDVAQAVFDAIREMHDKL